MTSTLLNESIKEVSEQVVNVSVKCDNKNAPTDEVTLVNNMDDLEISHVISNQQPVPGTINQEVLTSQTLGSLKISDSFLVSGDIPGRLWY